MFKLVPMLLLTQVFLAGPVNAQQTLCDPALKQIADNPLGYRLRGDRCEGIYVKDVGATILRVVALIEAFEDIDAAAAKPLIVQWVQRDTIVGANPVRLRAEGLKRRSYYRMDTVRPFDSLSFTWPSDILAAQRLERLDIGITAVTRGTVGGTERDVYLPVRIRQQASTARAGSYTLVVLPGVELDEVFISLGAAGSQGHPQVYIKDSEPLRFGYYPAERAIVVPLSGLTSGGIYYAQVGARLRGGGSVTVELWFHHDGHRPG